MVKFDTKLQMTTYLAKTNSREGKYVVLQDETMQNLKATYTFVNNELVLESGGTKTQNWRSTVETFAAISTVTDPLGMDAVIVTADETHNNNKTWYLHDGYQWNYKGAYQKRETDYLLSAKDTRGSVINQLELDFDYIVGNNEVDIYLDGVLANQYLTEFGDVGFASRTIKFKIDIPISTDIEVRKSVPNIDDEPRTNDEVYVGAFKHNYTEIEKYMKYEKSVVIEYNTFADAQNDLLLVKEGQVIRTFGHVTKNDGKGRYWILESTDKDFGYKNKTESLFINRLIGSDEKQPGELFPLAGSETSPPETVKPEGQIANRADFKRVWAWAVANGRVVTEAEWATNTGCFSSGDLSTTFRFPLAKDFIRAKESGRNVGSFQGDAFQGHWHNLYFVTNSITGGGGGDNTGAASTSRNNAVREAFTDGTNGTPRISNETRPKNIAQQYFIKI